MKRFVYSLFLALAVLLNACDDTNNLDIDVSGTPLPKVKIKRYEQAMFRISADSFITNAAKMQKEFPVFLQGDITDTAALIELKSFFTDPHMMQLYRITMDQYPSLNMLEDDIAKSLQYYYHYLPEATSYDFYSYVSGLDIASPIKFVGENLIIGIDNYLGKEQNVYSKSGFPNYQMKWLIEERIIPDCMTEIASGLMPEQEMGESLLDNMIYRGKLLYFAQAMQPNIPDSLLLKYSNKQYEWCKQYEDKIWGVMIDNEFLFKKERVLVRKFMDDGPFTAVFSKESPARTGWFIGWRIVSMYMNRTDATIQEMLDEKDAHKILKLSKYRPKS
ncbi:MAG: hypothetical protein KAG64_08150 [Bacteroidales bacterium]|nr:hypothetical protein [Bacteroidales bacterium]